MRGVTLAERVQWILDNCRTPSGAKWTAKDLSLAAGLTQSHVGQILRGTVKGGRVETLQAIAQAASVSPQWFLTGEGKPHDTQVSRSIEPVLPLGDADMEWRFTPGFEEAKREVMATAPVAPEFVIDGIGRRRGLWVPNPMTAAWLLVEVHQALKAMPPTERARLLLEEMDRAVEKQRLKDAALAQSPAAEAAQPVPTALASTPPTPVDASKPEPKSEAKPKTKKSEHKQTPEGKKR